MKYIKFKFRIPIPQGSEIYVEKGDIANNLLLYEVDQLEVLEDIKIVNEKLNFHVKDGQFVNKGDLIFTEGVLGHKAMVSDFSGIVEIKPGRCRILGQKQHFEKRIHMNGKVLRVVPNRFVEISCLGLRFKPVFFVNTKVKSTSYTYFHNRSHFEKIDLSTIDNKSTLFINDNVYIDDLAKISALGIKRVVVNGILVNDMRMFKKELEKFDAFAVISGFGELISRQIEVREPQKDILWSKNSIILSDQIEIQAHRIFEHPFWGVTGEFEKKNEFIGELNYNGNVIEFYLKNLEKND